MTAKESQSATKAPLSGSFQNPKEAVLTAIGNVFKNAFMMYLMQKWKEALTLMTTGKRKRRRIDRGNVMA